MARSATTLAVMQAAGSRLVFLDGAVACKLSLPPGCLLRLRFACAVRHALCALACLSKHLLAVHRIAILWVTGMFLTCDETNIWQGESFILILYTETLSLFRA